MEGTEDIAFSIVRCPLSPVQGSATSAAAKSCQPATSGISTTPSSVQRLIQSCSVYSYEWGIGCAMPRKFRTASPSDPSVRLAKLCEHYGQFGCKCFMWLLESRSILIDWIPCWNDYLNGSLLACQISCHAVEFCTDNSSSSLKVQLHFMWIS
jgi:hypothetical protein